MGPQALNVPAIRDWACIHGNEYMGSFTMNGLYDDCIRQFFITKHVQAQSYFQAELALLDMTKLPMHQALNKLSLQYKMQQYIHASMTCAELEDAAQQLLEKFAVTAGSVEHEISVRWDSHLPDYNLASRTPPYNDAFLLLLNNLEKQLRSGLTSLHRLKLLTCISQYQLIESPNLFVKQKSLFLTL